MSLFCLYTKCSVAKFDYPLDEVFQLTTCCTMYRNLITSWLAWAVGELNAQKNICILRTMYGYRMLLQEGTVNFGKVVGWIDHKFNPRWVVLELWAPWSAACAAIRSDFEADCHGP